MRAPCTVQGPIPGIAVSSAMNSSSGSLLKTSGFSRPFDSRPARSRSVLVFRHDSPASRSVPGSTASSSAGEGRWPPNSASDAGQGPARGSLAWIRQTLTLLAVPRLAASAVRPQSADEIGAKARTSSSMQGNPVALSHDDPKAALLRAL